MRARRVFVVASLLLSMIVLPITSGPAAAAPGDGASINSAICDNGGNWVLEHAGLLPAFVCYDDVAEQLVVQNRAPYWLRVQGANGILTPAGRRFPSTSGRDTGIALALTDGTHVPPGAVYTYNVRSRTIRTSVQLLPDPGMQATLGLVDLLLAHPKVPDHADVVQAAVGLVDAQAGHASLEDAAVALTGAGLSLADAAGVISSVRASAYALIIDLTEQFMNNIDVLDALDTYNSGLLWINPDPDVAQYRNTIVQRKGDASNPQRSWVVSGDKKRYWIPDSSTYWCLRNRGFDDKGEMGVAELSELPVQPNRSIICGDPTLTRGRIMLRNTVLKSGDGRFTLKLQSDGNLVFRGPNGVIWANHKVSNYLVVQSDGNLVTYKFDGTPTWSSGTAGSGANRLVVQNDGNLVLYSPDRAVWTYRGRL